MSDKPDAVRKRQAKHRAAQEKEMLENKIESLGLNVDFLRPSTVEEVLTVKSQVVRAGKTLAHVDCQIFGSDGKLKAKATSNLTKTSFGFK